MVENSVRVSFFFDPSAVAMLVQTASKFQSRISLVQDEKTANAKSIMGIISLNMQEGETIKIVAEGSDAAAAASELEAFFKGMNGPE